MKAALSTLLAVSAMVAAAPAMAQNHDVSRDALSALGLGGMNKVSDERAMDVRGKAVFASVGGAGLAFGGVVYTQGDAQLVFGAINGNGYKAFESNANTAPPPARAQAEPKGAAVNVPVVVGDPANPTFVAIGQAYAGNAALISIGFGPLRNSAVAGRFLP